MTENNFKNEFIVVVKVLLLINLPPSKFERNFLLPCICSEIIWTQTLKIQEMWTVYWFVNIILETNWMFAIVHANTIP